MLQNFNDIITLDDEGKSAALLYACESKENENIVRSLLESAADVNTVDRDGNSPLNLAVQNRCSYSVVLLLLEFGALVNVRNRYHRAPLHSAVETVRPSVVKQFLNRGADINIVDDDGDSPLHFAVRIQDNLDLLKLLLDRGALVNAKNYFHDCPLHIAVKELASLDSIKLLLDRGADVNLVGKQGNSPLHYAVQKSENLDLLKLLLDHGALVNVKNDNQDGVLHTAIKQFFPSLNVIKQLLDLGADANLVGGQGNSPLHYAVGEYFVSLNPTILEYAVLNITKMLLEHGALVNVKNDNHDTPLMRIISKMNPCLDVIKLLLDRGSDVNKVGLNGNSVLHYAVNKSCKLDIVKLLLAYGARVYIKNKFDQTPLEKAVDNVLIQKSSDKISVIELLLLYGSNPVVRSIYLKPGKEDVLLELVKLLIKYNILLSSQFNVVRWTNWLDILAHQSTLKHCMEEHLSELNEMRKEYIAESISLYDFLSKSYYCKHTLVNFQLFASSTWSVLNVEKYPLYRKLLLHKLPRKVIVQQLEKMYTAVKCNQPSGTAVGFDSIDHMMKYLSKEDLLNLGLTFQLHM